MGLVGNYVVVFEWNEMSSISKARGIMASDPSKFLEAVVNFFSFKVLEVLSVLWAYSAYFKATFLVICKSFIQQFPLLKILRISDTLY